MTTVEYAIKSVNKEYNTNDYSVALNEKNSGSSVKIIYTTIDVDRNNPTLQQIVYRDM